VQLQIVRRDGTALWVEVNSSPLAGPDGRPCGALSTYVDVTDRVERERRIRAEADTDELTGLANRRALQRMLRAALARARAHDLSVGVLMFGEPLELDGVEASLRAAVCVACHPGDGDDLECLLAAADRAMYARKAQ
jgi:GGDEF domain-containing protein